MSYFVYILISEKKEKWSYVGSTNNLFQRIKDHNYGKTKSTKAFRPLKLIYYEELSNKEVAYRKELYFKSGIGRERKAKIIKQYLSEVV